MTVEEIEIEPVALQHGEREIDRIIHLAVAAYDRAVARDVNNARNTRERDALIREITSGTE